MRKIVDFLSGVKVELTKVVWPTPQQTIRMTILVVIVTIGVGFFVGGIDLLLTQLLALILNK